jgi:erythromycin esterase-like protein
MESIMQYLLKTDNHAYNLAVEAFRCFEPYRGEEGVAYARASRIVPELCEQEVIGLLKEIQQRLPSYNSDYENVFSAEQNALIAVNAEKYYRAMIAGGPHSWNIRDRHMADTLDRVLNFHGEDAKVIVWEHNTHIGDARATDMIKEGMYNIGELARVAYGDHNVVLVGFGSWKGTVMAGRSWGARMEIMNVPEAKQGSWEWLLHEANPRDQLFIMEDFMHDDAFMENHLGHRAIGVVYSPQREQYGNYVPSIMPLRYDCFIHLDQTKALHPLHLEPRGHQMPETYPFGV